jgi:heme oxygenase
MQWATKAPSVNVDSKAEDRLMSADFEKSDAESGLKVRPLEFLRKETGKLHAQLEASVDLNRSLGSVSTYRSLLHRYLSVYRPFEDALSGMADLLNGTSWRYHGKVTLLEGDLLALDPDLRTNQLTRWSALPKFDNPDSALGALYVVEGSSLGGQVIYREVQRRLGLDARSGAAFFFGAGAQTGVAWKEFTVMLDQQISDPELAASAACAMFEAFRHGLQENEEALTQDDRRDRRRS